MAVPNVFSSGTTASSSEVNANFNDVTGSVDTTNGSLYKFVGIVIDHDEAIESTTEWQIGQITIPANTVSKEIFISGLVLVSAAGGQVNGANCKIRVGSIIGSEDYFPNVAKKNFNLIVAGSSGGSGVDGRRESFIPLIYRVADQTWSNDIQIQITGTNNVTSNYSYVEMEEAFIYGI